jgi:hypothetical protein
VEVNTQFVDVEKVLIGSHAFVSNARAEFNKNNFPDGFSTSALK